MVTTAYVAGLLTAACLMALIQVASEDRATELLSEPKPESEEEAPCQWRRSWQLRTQTCLEELRSADAADDCTARVEALQWARRLHFERRSHTYQAEQALEDAETFWEEVNEVLRPSRPG